MFLLWLDFILHLFLIFFFLAKTWEQDKSKVILPLKKKKPNKKQNQKQKNQLKAKINDVNFRSIKKRGHCIKGSKPCCCGLEHIRSLAEDGPKLGRLGYDTASDYEVFVVEIFQRWSCFSLKLLPGPLWTGMVIPVVLAIGQIGLFKNCWYFIVMLDFK